MRITKGRAKLVLGIWHAVRVVWHRVIGRCPRWGDQLSVRRVVASLAAHHVPVGSIEFAKRRGVDGGFQRRRDMRLEFPVGLPIGGIERTAGSGKRANVRDGNLVAIVNVYEVSP